MTFSQLLELFEYHNVPKDATIESDSGWECGPTDCDGLFYNRKTNIVVITQDDERDYSDSDDWENISHLYKIVKPSIASTVTDDCDDYDNLDHTGDSPLTLFYNFVNSVSDYVVHKYKISCAINYGVPISAIIFNIHYAKFSVTEQMYDDAALLIIREFANYSTEVIKTINMPVSFILHLINNYRYKENKELSQEIKSEIDMFMNARL